MFCRFTTSAAIAIGLLWLSGCGPARLDVNKSLTVSSLEGKAIDLSPQPQAQTINVEFSTSGEQVSVFLFKEEDAKGEDGIMIGDPKKALGKVERSKGDKFSAELPANTSARVVIRGDKKTEVTVKVNNKK